jgi:hypothetical protein
MRSQAEIGRVKASKHRLDATSAKPLSGPTKPITRAAAKSASTDRAAVDGRVSRLRGTSGSAVPVVRGPTEPREGRASVLPLPSLFALKAIERASVDRVAPCPTSASSSSAPTPCGSDAPTPSGSESREYSTPTTDAFVNDVSDDKKQLFKKFFEPLTEDLPTVDPHATILPEIDEVPSQSEAATHAVALPAIAPKISRSTSAHTR